ncbi:MAG: hypothetical protein IJ601_04595 [Acidaminococcaceae bacterium]|nr:hypothetical protein [Acidaminococcaceae bacterium]
MAGKANKNNNANFWDSEMLIGYINSDELHKTSISICTKNNKNFISITKMVRTQANPTFKPTGGTAIPYQTAQQVQALIGKAIAEGKKLGW